MLTADDLGLGVTAPKTAHPYRTPKPRRFLGVKEARAAGATTEQVRLVTVAALDDLHGTRVDHRTEHRRWPAHLLLGLLGEGSDPAEIHGATPAEQSRVKVALLRLTALLEQGVKDDTLLQEAVDIPAVFRDPHARRADPRRVWGATLPEIDLVLIPPGNPGRTRRAEQVARRVVFAKDAYAASGWSRGGYLVARVIAEREGWAETACDIKQAAATK